MRRVLTFLTAIVLLSGSLAIGVFTADLPFWRRALDLPLAPGEMYSPSVLVGHASAEVTPTDPVDDSLDPARLARAATRARDAGADALLVLHRGRLQFERYFRAGATRYSMQPADFLARPLAAMAVGLAQAEGRIGSLDAPISKYLPEWNDDPRGAITLRQLLNETSGLEKGVDTVRVLGRSPFTDWSRLPKFATARGVRLLLGNDFEATALGFRLEHEPGGFFNVSPVNSQLAAIIVERAVGAGFENYLDQRVVGPAALSMLELQLDRASGMPAAYCCLRATARDVLRIADLLLHDGERREAGSARVLPGNWLTEMRKGSRANPAFGLQIERLDRTPETWQLGGGMGGVAWLVPSDDLAIVMLAHRDVSVAADVLEMLRGSVRK